MKKTDIIKRILGEKYLQPPQKSFAKAYAPTNIALVKYWGKRNTELNLPVTSSLSISLPNKGAEVSLSIQDKDEIILNDKLLDPESKFAKRLYGFLNLFRENQKFLIKINSTIPIAAGLASSACGFASLVKVLNDLYSWNLSPTQQSILARLGSGSASRSLWNGFVEWRMGEREDGMDSFAQNLEINWPELCVGLLIMNAQEKSISSRQAMQQTIETSDLYSTWPEKVSADLMQMKLALQQKDFELLGKTAESNAMAMHAAMLAANPPINFSLPETKNQIQKIQQLRQAGLSIYFTQDAGPNLKLLFLRKNEESVRQSFPALEVIYPFN